ncbi:MAG: response regulator [Sphingobium phenoxybenzoativorans]
MTKRVLIVEDEIFVALEIEHIVRAVGMEVSAIAADRKDALAAAPDSDIALVDLNLRDGPTGPLIGQALAERHGVRVIYVTANPAQIGASAANALGVITKPFRETTIRAALMAAAEEKPDLSSLAISGFIPFSGPSGSLTGAEYQG